MSIYMYHLTYVDKNKLHVIIVMLHVDIIYLACKRQKYAIIIGNMYLHVKITIWHADIIKSNIYQQNGAW